MQGLSSGDFFSGEPFEHEELLLRERPVWEPLGLLSRYLETKTLGKIEVEIPPTAYLVRPAQITIGKGCVIEPGAYIEGPVILGPYTVVRHGAYLRGPVITGTSCVIGHGTEVKHSLLLHRARAAHFNYVGDSILGHDVNLGAGVKLANFRFDGGLITFSHRGTKIHTGLRKLGAIIGDKTQVGCNAVTQPGTLMGPHVFCYPCETIRGVLPPSTIYRRGRCVKRLNKDETVLWPSPQI